MLKCTKTGFIFFAFMTFLTACGQLKYKKTASGVAYKIFEEGKGPSVKIGQFVKFDLKIVKGDSVLTSSYGKLANYIPIDSFTTKGNQHSFVEVFHLMKVGDSAVCIMFVDSLRKRAGSMLPPSFKKGEEIKAYVHILSAFNSQDEVKADYDKEMEKQKQKELATIDKYLKEKKINAQKTTSGVFVEIQQPGEGIQADSGKSVTVMYKGQLFNGKVFDTNMDSAFKHTEPFTFTMGRGEVIKGWDEGIKLFKKGGKGRLFIPSTLAYGPRQAGADIEPYSNLIFDVDVKDVKDVPVQSKYPLTK